MTWEVIDTAGDVVTSRAATDNGYLVMVVSQSMQSVAVTYVPGAWTP